MPSRINRAIKTSLSNKGITGLHPFQQQAFQTFTDSQDNMIVAAGTGRGKTEAVLIPLVHKLSLIEQTGSLKAIFVMPLVALANDQADRIESFLKNMNLTVFKYHGDVSSSKKNAFFRNPTDILIITPESLQSLLRRDLDFTTNLFSTVEEVVIDEVHYFLANQRGHHLYNLLWHMNRLITNIRISALSATIKVDEQVTSWFTSINNRQLVQITDDFSNQKITKLMYVHDDEQNFEEKTNQRKKTNKFNTNKQLLDDLAASLANHKGLIFFDDKATLEATANTLNDNNHRTVFTHHGSLSKELRETNEHKIKTMPNASLCCTSTMELGIDIGDVEVIYFTNSPKSVASYLQRLGRSGRVSKVSKAKMYASNPKDTVYNYVLRELGSESEVEPTILYTHSLSKLFHTILMLTNLKPITDLKKVYAFISDNIYYKDISYPEFKELIADMLKNEYLIHYGQDIEIGDKGQERLESFEMLSYFDGDAQEIAVYDLNNNLLGMVSNKLFKEKHNTKFSLNGLTWLPQKYDGSSVHVDQSNTFEDIAFPSKPGSELNTLIINNYIKYLVEKPLNLEYCCEQSKRIIVDYSNRLKAELEGKTYISYTNKEYACLLKSDKLKHFKNDLGMFLFPTDKDSKMIINELEAAKKAVFEGKARTYDIKFAKYLDSAIIQPELKENQYCFETIIHKFED